MNSLKKGSIFLALIFILALSQSAFATSVCTTGTMASYANSTCTIGNYAFTFGATPYIWGPGDSDVPAGNVTVTPYGSGLAGSPTGFLFSAENWVNTNATGDAPTYADINIAFAASLAAAPGYNIQSTSLTLGVSLQNETGSAGVLAGENVYNTDTSASLGGISLTVLGNTDTSSTSLGGSTLSGSDYFSATNVNIDKDIALVAQDQNRVQVNNVLETFTYGAVPEPGPFVLTAAGLGLLILVRKRKQLLNVLGVVALFALISTSAHATPVCTSATLATYLSSGACTLNGVTFTFDASSYSVTGTGSAPAASTIQVTPTTSATQIGFQFTLRTPAVTGGGQSENLTLTYTAQAVSANITSFSSQDTISRSGTGTLAGSNSKLKLGTSTLTTVTYPALLSGGGVGTPAFAAVKPPATVTVTNSFLLSSPGAPGLANSAHLSNFTNTFNVTQVPEPLTSVLCGAGLLVLGLAFRSRRAKA
jgi:hypothetical protein